jgi:hypothetical protein
MFNSGLFVKVSPPTKFDFHANYDSIKAALEDALPAAGWQLKSFTLDPFVADKDAKIYIEISSIKHNYTRTFVYIQQDYQTYEEFGRHLTYDLGLIQIDEQYGCLGIVTPLQSNDINQAYLNKRMIGCYVCLHLPEGSCEIEIPLNVCFNLDEGVFYPNKYLTFINQAAKNARANGYDAFDTLPPAEGYPEEIKLSFHLKPLPECYSKAVP